MKAPKNEGSGDFEKHPVGAARLVCSRIIDKGTVFDERKDKELRKINLFFESEILMEEGEFKDEPFLVMASFNYSMYQNSHLCQFIEQWRGKKFASQEEADDFDIEKLLGQTGYGNIGRSDDGKWTNIMSIMPLPKGMERLQIKGKSIVFDLENPDQNVFDQLSENMKLAIEKSKEYKAWKSGGNQNIPPSTPIDQFDDDIPF